MTREEKTVQRLKQKLMALGPMLPGSISEQWNVCGTPGCRCKDPEKPVRHGPYYQLSFTVGGKSSSLFLGKRQLAEARRRLERYRKFKAVSTQLVLAYVALCRRSGLNGRGA